MKTLIITIVLIVTVSSQAELESIRMEQLTDYRRSGDKIIKNADKRLNKSDNYGFMIAPSSIQIDAVKGDLNVQFRIATRRYMKFTRDSESLVYIFCGDTPEDARLVAVSSVEGRVKFTLRRGTLGKHIYLADSKGPFNPARLVIEKFTKLQKQS